MENAALNTQENIQAALAETFGKGMAEMRDGFVQKMNEALDANRTQQETKLQKMLDEWKAQSDIPTPSASSPFGENGEVRARRRSAHPAENEKGIRAARFIRCLAMKNNDRTAAAEFAKNVLGDEVVAKSLNESIMEAGGVLVPPEHMDEIIELLRPAVVVRALGARVLPMEGNSLSIPAQTGASTSSYEAELQAVPPTQSAYDMLTFSQKKLMTKVPVSNDLLKNISPASDAFIRDDLIKSSSVRQDAAFLRGDGSSNTPKGVRFLADTGNVFARAQAAFPSTTEEINRDLFQAMINVEENDVILSRGAWAMRPGVAGGIMRLRDVGNGLLYAAEMAGGRLLGWEFGKTTSLPTNLVGAGGPGGGGLADKSEILFFEAPNFIIAESDERELMAFNGGAFDDGAGTVISGISTDQTVLRLIEKHDTNFRQRGREASVITGIDWHLA